MSSMEQRKGVESVYHEGGIQLPLPTKVNKWSWSKSKRSSRTWICRTTILRVQYQMS